MYLKVLKFEYSITLGTKTDIQNWRDIVNGSDIVVAARTLKSVERQRKERRRIKIFTI